MSGLEPDKQGKPSRDRQFSEAPGRVTQGPHRAGPRASVTAVILPRELPTARAYASPINRATWLHWLCIGCSHHVCVCECVCASVCVCVYVYVCTHMCMCTWLALSPKRLGLLLVKGQ